MKHKLLTIISSDTAIIILSIMISFTISFLVTYYLCQDDTREAIIFSAIMAGLVGAMMIHNCILNLKNYFDCDHMTDIRHVFTALGLASYCYLSFFIARAIRDDLSIIDKIVEGTAFFSCFCFSLWAYVSVANTKKYATILTITTFISSIFILPIHQGEAVVDFMFDYAATGDILKVLNSYNISQILNIIADLIIFTVCIAGCLKGLIITFSRAWRKQFTNQSYPFTIIFIVVLFHTLIFLVYFSIRFYVLFAIKEYIHHIQP